MKKLALHIKFLAIAALIAAVAILPTTTSKADAATYLDRGDITALAYLGGTDGNFGEIAVATNDEIFFLNEDGTPVRVTAGETTTDKPPIDQSGVTAMAATSDALYVVAGNDLYDAGDFSASVASNIELIASEGGNLYYYDGDKICLYGKNNDGTLVTTEKFTVNGITSLAVMNDNVYYISGGFVFKNDEILYENSSLRSLSVIGGNLYGISRNGEIVLAESGEVIYSGKPVTLLTRAKNDLLFATSTNEIYLFDGTSAKLVAASASGETGFYDYPTDAVVRFGKLYVADYSNGRVAVVSGGETQSTEYLSVPFPRALDVSSDGAIYIASNKNVVKFDGKTGNVVFTAEKRVLDVFISRENVVYCVTSDGVFSVSDGSVVTENADGGTVLPDESTVVFSGAEIRKTDGSVVATLGENIKAIAADNDGNLYALTDGATSTSLYKITADGAELKKSDLPSGTASLYVSRSASPIGSFGDVVIADKEKNRIITVPADEAGVPAVPKAPTADEFDDERIFRFAKTDTVLYRSTDESDVAISVKKDKRLIVLKYDFGYGYAYCAVENELEELVYGYAFRSTLTDPLAYVEPKGSYCIVYSDSVKLYSLPSKGAPEATSLTKNERLEMLSFPTCEWYRVKTSNGKIGYVPTGTVSVNSFVPNGDRPQINGEIIEYDGETNAAAYRKTETGDYEIIEGVSLPVGTKIEVIEGFDNSRPYAQIRYYDDTLGTLTCYVKTGHIRFNGLTSIQIVAIVIAAITFILLVFLLIRLYMRRRKI